MSPERLALQILCLNDFEAAARARLPRPIFGYVQGAVEDNLSFRMNADAFRQYAFITRTLTDVSGRDTRRHLLGKTYASPFGICPMGLLGLSCFEGDLNMVGAARDADVPCIISGASMIPMEEIARHAPHTWFQAYVKGNPESYRPMLARIDAAGFRTLVITVDIPVSANRENNVRTGFTTPLRPGLRLCMDVATRPRWLFGTLLRTLAKRGMPYFENSFAQRGAPIFSRTASRDFGERDTLAWSHLADMRERWKGHLVLKGVLAPDDVDAARRLGMDGVILSNHGGRQLDGAVSPLHMLRDCLARAGAMPLMLDGGVRRGSDVLKAVALGARCVFIGRPFNFALATAGRAGVAHAIDLLKREIDRDLAMLGANDLDQLAYRASLCHLGRAPEPVPPMLA